ncbi:MAG: peptide deformylase [bacterium]|nr:peptide deformylase [bacterium]
MPILPIKKYPDPILYKKAKQVNKIRKNTLDLITNMLETMYAAKGIGLAANQVGVLQRIIVSDPDSANANNRDKNPRNPMVLINPEILFQEGENVAEEGCLSFPQVTGMVARAQQVRVKGLNLKGETVEIEAVGFPSRVLQHEIDHLNGIVFIDRMDKEAREAIRNQLEMLRKR